MKKTSLYLTEDEAAKLRRLSNHTGRSQAELVREAVTEYVTSRLPKRKFLSAGAGASDHDGKSSVADEDIDQVVYELIKERHEQERG